MSYYSAEELGEAEDTFHRQYGQTLAQWAVIEQRLFFWFLHATSLPEEAARGIFYSVKNFNGRIAMLGKQTAAIDALIKRCKSYSAFRNKITHGEAVYDFRKNSATYKQMLLIEGRELMEKAAEDAISLGYLAWGCDQLRELGRVIMDALDAVRAKQEAPLQECLEQLQKLPGGLYPNPRDQKK